MDFFIFFKLYKWYQTAQSITCFIHVYEFGVGVLYDRLVLVFAIKLFCTSSTSAVRLSGLISKISLLIVSQNFMIRSGTHCTCAPGSGGKSYEFSSVRLSVCNFFLGLAGYFFLIFCIGFNKHSKCWSFFWRKMLVFILMW